MLNNGKLVSVIVPVYNVKNTLCFCIDSICKQTYKNLEIIIVDDGSTDGSSKICDRLAHSDSRIKVFHKENGGLSDARNYGLKFSNGEIVSFVDSDDVIHYRFYEVLLSYLYKYNADIVSSSIVDFYNFDDELADNIQKKISCTDVYLYENSNILKEYFNPLSSRKIHHQVCIKLYDRNVLNNITFDFGKLHEDLFFTYKVLNESNRFVFVNECLYFHYFNKYGISNSYNVRNFKDELEATNNIFNFSSQRPELLRDIKVFCLNHFLYLIDRANHIDPKLVYNDVKYIKDWIKEYINKDKGINLILKIYVNLYVYFNIVFRVKNKLLSILNIRSN